MEESERTADFSLAPVDGLVGKSFEGLDCDGLIFIREGDAKDALVILIGNDKAAFGIKSHGDPGTLFGRNVVE